MNVRSCCCLLVNVLWRPDFEGALVTRSFFGAIFVRELKERWWGSGDPNEGGYIEEKKAKPHASGLWLQQYGDRNSMVIATAWSSKPRLQNRAAATAWTTKLLSGTSIKKKKTEKTWRAVATAYSKPRLQKRAAATAWKTKLRMQTWNRTAEKCQSVRH